MTDLLLDLLTNPDYNLWTWTVLYSLLAILASIVPDRRNPKNKS
jgi:hypothetical protein